MRDVTIHLKSRLYNVINVNTKLKVWVISKNMLKEFMKIRRKKIIIIAKLVIKHFQTKKYHVEKVHLGIRHTWGGLSLVRIDFKSICGKS